MFPWIIPLAIIAITATEYLPDKCDKEVLEKACLTCHLDGIAKPGYYPIYQFDHLYLQQAVELEKLKKECEK